MGLAGAGAGVALAGTALSMYAQFQGGHYASKVAKRNAEAAEAGAADALARGAEDEGAIRSAGRGYLGAQRVAYAASGVELGSGSPLDVAEGTAGITEHQRLIARNNAFRDAYGMQVGASLERARGRYARRAGTLGAGTTALTGSTMAFSILRAG